MTVQEPFIDFMLSRADLSAMKLSAAEAAAALKRFGDAAHLAAASFSAFARTGADRRRDRNRKAASDRAFRPQLRLRRDRKNWRTH